MSAEVIGIHGNTPQEPGVNQSAVTVVERLLEKVRAGEVTGVIVAMSYRNGLTEAEYGGYFSDHSMVGCLEDCKLSLWSRRQK